MAFKIDRYKMLIRNFSNWPEFLLSKIHKPDSFIFKRRDGFVVEVPKTFQSVFKENFFDQSYWRGFPDTISKNEPLDILDIGGNVGYFGLFAMSSFPNAKVYSFEPIPYNFREMESCKKQYGFENWHLYHQAVSDSLEPLTLYASRKDGFCLMASTASSGLLQHQFEIKSTTLKSIFDETKLDKFDLVKIDCEGSEYHILYSWTEFEFDRIDRLVIETHPNMDKPGFNHHDLLKYLETYGWKLNSTIEREGTGYIWAWK